MPTHFEGTRRETLALDAFIKLSRATATLSSLVDSPLSDYQLNQTQFGALEALYHLGALTQGEIAAKMLRSPANITAVIDQLEKRALVRRERGADDRRCVRIHLTPEGKKLVLKILPKHVTSIADAFDGLTAAEQQQLATLCRKLGLTAREKKRETESAGRKS